MSIDRYSFLLAIATFAMGTDAFIVAGILPQVADALTVTIGSAGLIVSVFSLSYAVSAPVVSVLTARVARKTILVGALMVFAAANVLSAMSATLPMPCRGRGESRDLVDSATPLGRSLEHAVRAASVSAVGGGLVRPLHWHPWVSPARACFRRRCRWWSGLSAARVCSPCSSSARWPPIRSTRASCWR
jgi:MFS family permease